MEEKSGEKCGVKMVFAIKMVVEWSAVYLSAARPHPARRNACEAAARAIGAGVPASTRCGMSDSDRQELSQHLVTCPS